jgi:hypothetical protein
VPAAALQQARALARRLGAIPIAAYQGAADLQLLANRWAVLTTVDPPPGGGGDDNRLLNAGAWVEAAGAMLSDAGDVLRCAFDVTLCPDVAALVNCERCVASGSESWTKSAGYVTCADCGGAGKGYERVPMTVDGHPSPVRAYLVELRGHVARIRTGELDDDGTDRWWDLETRRPVELDAFGGVGTRRQPLGSYIWQIEEAAANQLMARSPRKWATALVDALEHAAATPDTDPSELRPVEGGGA